MKYKVSAASCWNVEQMFETYGEKLKMFGATIFGKELTAENVENYKDEFCEIEIEINNFETIRDFIGTFGNIVMSAKNIKIYDDYIE